MSEAAKPSVSIVLEMENGRLIGDAEVVGVVATLCNEIQADAHAGSRPEVIFMMPGSPGELSILQEKLSLSLPELASLADVRFRSIEDGRYYSLKNEGARLARNDIVIFADSDTELEPGWLHALRDAFVDPEVMATNGFTYLLHSDFMSRVYALFWMFPLRKGDERFAAKRALNANNCAFRRSFFLENSFPDHPGFKVSCSLLLHQLNRKQVQLKRVTAYAGHKSPEGTRFFLWRALVTGRDNDRRYAAMRSGSRIARVSHAFRRFFTSLWRSSVRIVTKHRFVQLPFWQVPAALVVVAVFHLISFAGQFSLAAGLVRERVEHVPGYVIRS